MSEVTMINEQRMRDAGLSAEALRTAASADAHRWSSAPASKDLDAFEARVELAAQHLDALSAELDALPTTGWPGPEPLLEIRENPRMMRSSVFATPAECNQCVLFDTTNLGGYRQRLSY